ncbi:hypothetical protein SAICODRAFT_32354 [Saitoella complicata NRRL Y-17804]|uniref:uncharacterized protein n=1 Tax=Saitoella complicata (strain BCRC 22490 / CBS 7301 / JCM 7358 / NBRC 10748 / NRRL Y-17804) TaxID=698492 RepID=UPI0008681D9F|nr:uncharacterized protein SAICODRAFT_32354 [Saitoella complicata NRRL Y-17804]ODQ49726.1 hypothetical protein SAICODRAFT_32354 [Saitoella complicata NRRL Y-17804]
MGRRDHLCCRAAYSAFYGLQFVALYCPLFGVSMWLDAFSWNGLYRTLRCPFLARYRGNNGLGE